MKTIPFDIKYWPEIESGKYKLVNSEGKNVTVLDWEFHRGDSKVLIVKIARANGYEDAVLYTHDGKRISQIEDHLSIVTDEPEGLTEFEKEVQVASFLEIHPSDVDAIKEQAAHLLELARKELIPKGTPVWRRIRHGDRLPCHAYLWNSEYEKHPDCIQGRLIPNIPGVIVGSDTWYLPVMQIHDLPKEE